MGNAQDDPGDELPSDTTRMSSLNLTCRNPSLGVVLRLPILGADHPCVLLQLLDEQVQDIGAGGIFLVDVIVHGPHILRCDVQAFRDEVDRVRGENLSSRKARQVRRRDHGFDASVGLRVEGSQAFGQLIREFTHLLNDFIELQVQVSKVRSNNVPVCLLTLQMQRNQVDKNGLQVRAE
jgi:hypothetical protein